MEIRRKVWADEQVRMHFGNRIRSCNTHFTDKVVFRFDKCVRARKIIFYSILAFTAVES